MVRVFYLSIEMVKYSFFLKIQRARIDYFSVRSVPGLMLSFLEELNKRLVAIFGCAFLYDTQPLQAPQRPVESGLSW